jgi:hypothetical protein
MSTDTWTPEGQAKRIVELAEGYFQSRSRRGLTRLIGLSPSDWDYSPSDEGMYWNDIPHV